MSSSYYYGLFKQKKKEAEMYEKWIKQLQPIKTEIENNLDDKVVDVNNNIQSLVTELESAVRHSTIFDTSVQNVEDSKEACGYSDSHRSTASSSITSEIRSLSNKKDEAERQSQDYYNKYEEAKRQEEEEARRQREERLSRYSWMKG